MMLLTAWLLVGCGPGGARDATLGPAVEAAVAAAPNGGLVDLVALAPGPWDEVVVISPGTPASRIRGDLGFDWPGAADAASALENEDVEVLVFLSDGTVTRWAPVWMQYGAIPYGRWQASPADGRAGARFTVTRSAADGTVLAPVPSTQGS